MRSFRPETSVIVAVCLVQLCFTLVESLVLVYPAMYAAGYLLSHEMFRPTLLLWIVVGLLATVVLFPVMGAVQAWFLLRRGHSSGWSVSAAVDTCLALAYAALMLALYNSPPSSGHSAWAVLSVMISLPLIHLAVISTPAIHRRLVVPITSTTLQRT